MAGLVHPTRILLDERFLADRFPVADAGRISAKLRVVGARAVVGGSFGREAHRHVGIALAGGETVTHADDEEIRHLRERLGHLPAADLDLDPGPAGIRDLQLHGGIAGERYRLAAPTPTLWNGEPRAIDNLGIVQSLQVRADHMALGIYVVGPFTARIAIALAVPACLVEHQTRSTLPGVAPTARARPTAPAWCADPATGSPRSPCAPRYRPRREKSGMDSRPAKRSRDWPTRRQTPPPLARGSGGAPPKRAARPFSASLPLFCFAPRSWRECGLTHARADARRQSCIL